MLSLLLYQSNVYSKSVVMFIVERQHNSFIVAQDDINLGPRHMSPVDRAGPVSKILPYL